MAYTKKEEFAKDRLFTDARIGTVDFDGSPAYPDLT